MKKLLLLLSLLFAITLNAQPRHNLSFFDLVGLNLITGASAVFKFGRNPSMDIGTPEDCWGGDGDYNWITTASVLTAVSTSGNDTAGGTGARTILIEGLDSDYNIVSETLTLTGLVAATTSQEFYRINKGRVLTAGSSDANEGTIIIKEGSNPVGHFAINEGQTTLGVYTVPASHKFLIYDYLVGLGKKQTTAGEGHFEVRPQGGAWNLKQIVSLSNSSSFLRTTKFPYLIPEKTDIRIRFEEIATNATSGACSFDGILIDTTKFHGY